MSTTKPPLDEEGKLRKNLRLAEARLDFANNGCFSLLGLAVAALAIMATLLPQVATTPGLLALAIAQMVLSLLAALGAIVLVALRGWWAGAIISAEDDLEGYRQSMTTKLATPVTVGDAPVEESVDKRTLGILLAGLAVGLGLVILARS